MRSSVAVAIVAAIGSSDVAFASWGRKPAPTPAKSWAGAPTADSFPPTGTSGGNNPLFPPESVLGNAGPTPTGDEPFAVATAPAYPYNTGFAPLLEPGTLGKQTPVQKPSTSSYSSFNPLRYWGNLSPWYSTSFGREDVSPLIPPQCSLTQVHLVHRHGARYPTGGSAPAEFAGKLNAAASTGKVIATGPLAFLNDWTFKLGAEILTPFGRKQMFDLGVTFRSSYGDLLKNFTASGKLPVFRSESEDRMVKSALNFAAGFFGIPYENQYNLELTVENPGFNNTFAPYDTCTNSNNQYSDLAYTLAGQWQEIYLKETLPRLQANLKGVNLTNSDVAAMLNLCAYETVALGYSSFCPLFTEEEFKGFEYSFDIEFWYGNGPGSPYGAAMGAGYANELLSRLLHVQPSTNPFSVNQTLDGNPTTFPLDQSIYVDATHDTVLTNIVTALNFTVLARNGPLPTTHIPKDHIYVTSTIAPFGTNFVGQVLDCADIGPSIRFFLNDGALPIGIEGCPSEDKYNRCPLKTYTKGLAKRLASIDWNHDCNGNYTISSTLTDGRAPKH